jgi:hypothetical protein
MNCIQHCFLCRPANPTMLEYAGIEPMQDGCDFVSRIRQSDICYSDGPIAGKNFLIVIAIVQ